MTTASFTTPPVTIDRSRIRRPGILRLTRVEMRKMVDTRSGLWLLMAIAILSLLIVGLSVFAGSRSEHTFDNYFQGTLVPVGFLLPVLGILMVTSEYSQRTSLATFSLVPARSRVMVAKYLAGIIYSLLSIVSSVIIAGLGVLVTLAIEHGGTNIWSISIGGLASAALFQVIGVAIGLGFGMLLMNSPAAIVLYFVLPTGLLILGAAVKAFEDWVVWLDITGARGPLADHTITSEGWQHLGTSSLLWILLPLVLGGLRVSRRELK